VEIPFCYGKSAANLVRNISLILKSTVMKKFLLAVAILSCSVLFAADPGVDEKVVKSFNTAFPNAEKVQWFELDGLYEVTFENDLVKCRMWYGKNGAVLRTLRYYKAEGLSPFLLAKIENKYSGKTIFGVTEVSTADGVTFNVILEDDKKWYHIAADAAGNLTLTKKYNKA
jgi:hypothetical protein